MKSFYKILINIVFYGFFGAVSLFLVLYFALHFAGYYGEHPKEYSITKGNINISIPDSMKVGQDSIVFVSVIMGEGLELKNNADDKIYKIETKTSSLMKADIYDVSGGKLRITPLFSNSEQAVDSILPTTWKWGVTPLESGQAQIAVVLSAKVYNGIERSFKNFVVYDKYIDVRVSGFRVISNFFKKNWQWIISIIFLPLILWCRKLILARINRPKKRNPMGFNKGN